MPTYRCAGITRDGARCWARVSAESEPAYCPRHRPKNVLDAMKDELCRDELDTVILAAKEAVVKAALAWWENCRPVAWDEEQHLANPTINTKNDAEKHLASARARKTEEGGRKCACTSED